MARDIRDNVAAIGATRVAAIALDGLTYIVVARFLGPAQYGTYVSILAFLTLIDLAADMMTLDVTVREIAAEPHKSSTWLTAATVLRLALAFFGVGAFAVYLRSTGLAHDPDTARAAMIAALILPVGALRTPLAAFRAHLRMHYELAIVAATRLLNLLLVVLVAYRGGALVALFVVTILSRAMLAILAWTAAVRRFDFRLALDGRALVRLTRESMPMGISGVFVAIQLKADLLMLGAMVGAEAAGLYGVVAQLPEYLLYVPVIFTTPVLPVMSRCAAERSDGEFQRLYQATVDTVMALVIPVAVVGILVPRQMVVFLFGSAYAPAASVVPLLMVSVVCMWLSHAMAIATVAARLQRHFIWIQGICVALFIGVDLVLIPTLGVTGAAIGRLASATLAPALTYFVLRRHTGALLSVRGLGRAGIAAIAMAVGVVLTAAQPLYVIGAVGLALYAVGLWTIGCNPFASLVRKETLA